MTKAKVKEQPALFADAEPAPQQPTPTKKAEVAKPKATGTAVAKVEELPPTTLLAVIARAAMNQNVDVPKMKELLAMQREIEQAQDAAAFNRALLAAQGEIPRIVKDKKTDKAPYATLENVSKSIDKICRSHGFVMSFGTADSPLPKHYRIVCDLSHSYGSDDYPRGQTRRYHVDLESDTVGAKGVPNKTAIQGVGATMSYGRRYLKVMMFDLTIVGEDNDGAKRKRAPAGDEAVVEQTDPSVPLVNGSQAKELLAQITACGVGAKKFCAHYAIKAVHELPAHQYDEAIKACNDYARKPPKANG